MRFRPLRILAVAAMFIPISALPGQAADGGRPVALPDHGGPHAPRIGPQGIADPNFAGYEDSGAYPTVKISASFVVPRLTCSGADQAIVPEVGTYTSSSRSGPYSAAGLFVGCYLGKPHFWPTLVLNGKTKNYAGTLAREKDTIVVTVTESATRATLSIVDKTHRFTITRRGHGNGSSELYYPWVGSTSWYTSNKYELGVPQFRPLNYAKALLQGEPLNGGMYTLSEYERYSGSTLQVATTPFGPDNESFSNLYEHS